SFAFGMRSRNLAIIAGAVLFAREGLANFSLSQLQPIAGFSDMCTKAYNTPLTACTISDFYQGSTCSPQCVDFLEKMTKLLNQECKGTTAFPNTLIGMFFQKTAVQKLCATVSIVAVPPTGAGQGSEPSSGGSATMSSAASGASGQGSLIPFVGASATASSQSSSIATSTSSQTTTTTVSPSSQSSTTTSTASSTQTSVTLVTSTSSQRPGNGVGSASASPNTPSPVSSSSNTQAKPTGPSQSNGGGGGGNNNGNGGTVLDAASAANNSARALPLELTRKTKLQLKMKRTNSAIAASPAETTDIATTEAALNAQQSQAFTSLLRIGHLSPALARSIASLYRAALAGNTFIHQQAEHHGIDTAWLCLVYLIGGYIGLTAAELGMAFAEKLIGLTKWVLWVPMVGILVMKVGRRKSLKEIVELLTSDGGKGEGKGDFERIDVIER
ncbi:MAG: hypothetical protein Q9218_007352, partial [Villophora microphyllina]